MLLCPPMFPVLPPILLVVLLLLLMLPLVLPLDGVANFVWLLDTSDAIRFVLPVVPAAMAAATSVGVLSV